MTEKEVMQIEVHWQLKCKLQIHLTERLPIGRERKRGVRLGVEGSAVKWAASEPLVLIELVFPVSVIVVK